MPLGHRGSHTEGFVLPLTLIVIVILTTFAMGISKLSRLHMDDIAIRKQNLSDEILLRNTLQQVAYALLTGTADKNSVTAAGTRIALDGEPFTQQGVTVSVQDAAGLLGLGFFNEQALFRVLAGLTDKDHARQIAARVGDWIDSDDLARPSGMEASDYIKQHIPWLPRNAPLRSLDELLAIPGVTAQLYNGHDGVPGLRDLLLAGGIGYVNWATVPPPLLRLLLEIPKTELPPLLRMRKQREWRPFMATVHAKSPLLRMELMLPSNLYAIRLTLPSGSSLRVLLQKELKQKVPYRYLLWQYPDRDRG